MLNVKNKIIENSIKILNLKINIKEKIDQEKANLISEYLKIITYKKKIKNKNLKNKKNNKNLKKRSVIISIMGQVNHGKTSILKKIIKKNIKEETGITQNINIYKIKKNNKKIIFLDTPGHEDLENFRQKSIRITDIIILIIAVDDDVSQQTIKIIKKAKKLKIPTIINFNKIDIKKSNISLIKNQLILKKIIKESHLNNYIFNQTSIKTKIGIKSLIENLILLSKIISPKINIKDNFKGIIIENKIKKNIGVITTIIIKSGKVKIGDLILSEIFSGKIKIIYDENDNIIKNSKKNIIVKIVGFSETPKTGKTIIKLQNKNILENIISFRKQKLEYKKLNKKNKLKNFYKKYKKETKKPILNLIIKSETYNILKSIKKSILKLNKKIFKVKFIKISMGDINLNDIKLASITKSCIIGFNLKIKNNINKLAKIYKIEIINYNTIYNIIDYIKNLILKFTENKIKENVKGKATIVKIFKLSDNKSIAGCIVTEGLIKLDSPIKIIRNNIEIFNGKINSLKYLKDNVKEIKKDLECGIFIKNFNNYLLKDIIESY